MCGIVAYVGNKSAAALLIEGLKRLEYRGYDSAGLAVVRGQDQGIALCRSVGRVSVLEARYAKDAAIYEGQLGVAHTRWATHGKVTEENAHPHIGATRSGHTVALVHNGTIENYATLRKYLEGRGHQFYGQSDTEVLAKLVAELYEPQKNIDLERAVQLALQEVTGAYAIAVICDREAHTLICARKGSPLTIGLADNAYVVASDQSAIVAHTTQVIHLNDYQVARLCAGPSDHGSNEPWSIDFRTTTIDNVTVEQQVTELELDLQQIELAGYPHYMLKEIMEQPEALRTSMTGRLDLREGRVVLGGLTNMSRDLARARKFIITGQGTAYHAALIGEYLMEEMARIPCECEYASEFRYRNPVIEEGTFVVAVSQSGETSDTLEALREARERGAVSLGVVNVVGSTMSRETDAGVYLRVGPEIGVASTKAFLGQLAVLTMMALYVGRRRHLSQQTIGELLTELAAIPDKISQVLKQSEKIQACVEKVVDRNNWLFLGRGYNYPVALEGALKLKELSYIHAEGMPAAEMKHGPIALIDEGMPVVFIATQGNQYDKVISNIEEVKARGGRIIAVATEGDQHIERYCEGDFIFRVPHAAEPLQPLLTTVPLQLLAYHAALQRGHDVDKPRNLAKSVTVE
ncbi:MAG: glutamine--fructose-6-phosphate transaminase (isomerizing) [Phycisphaeraceae bacterium]|nr:glutamine--fructose-6-phosphate transaminase (isomerizing) [Phycisphaeraceae bacterium]